MKKYFYFIIVCGLVGTAHAATDLKVAIENVRTNCAGISSELSDLKKMAGINTAVTGVGTVAGGVALGTGIAKANVDKKAEELEAELAAEIARLKELGANQSGLLSVDVSGIPLAGAEVNSETHDNNSVSGGNNVELSASITQKQEELTALNNKSKNLGNWRTGSMAVGTVANIAGAAIAGNNRVKGDLKEQINACLAAVKELSNSRMQARMSGATDAELKRAEEIVRACEEWSTVDLGSINSRASGAAVSSGVGATLGLAGTVTSAMANTNKTRDDNTDSGKKKEKGLNVASNVLAGGTTIASGVATVFNATQIRAIKRAVTVADKCEEVLK